MGLIQELQRADAQRRREVAALAREVASRLGDFRKGDAQRRREVAALKTEVATLCADADAFVRHLHKVSADRRREVAAMGADAHAFVGHLHQVSTERRSEVATMKRGVAALRADHRAFHGRLHKLSAARHTEVWGRPVPAPPKAALSPAAPAAAQETPVTLRDVIFTYLAEHPDGARLTQLEQDLGMARIKLAGEIRSLMEDKKVQKRELLYFAV